MLGSALDLVMAAGHPFYDNDHQKVDTPDYSFMYEDDYAFRRRDRLELLRVQR